MDSAPLFRSVDQLAVTHEDATPAKPVPDDDTDPFMPVIEWDEY